MAYSVGWGTDVGAFAHKCPTAREALALAEGEMASGRPDVIVIDLTSESPVAIDTLRELAEEEAEGESNR